LGSAITLVENEIVVLAIVALSHCMKKTLEMISEK